MRKLVVFLLTFSLSLAVAADTLVGSWNDDTPTGPDYAPQYNVECRLVGQATNLYSDYTLGAPTFTATIDVPDVDVLECRARNANMVVASNPVYSNWTPWASATVALTPVDPTSVLFILVK